MPAWAQFRQRVKDFRKELREVGMAVLTGAMGAVVAHGISRKTKSPPAGGLVDVKEISL